MQASTSHDADHATEPLVVPAFALLFAMALDRPFTGLPPLPPGTTPLPADSLARWMAQLANLESQFLGRAYVSARRLQRIPVGRIPLGESARRAGANDADLYLLVHVSGIVVWEAWITAPEQPFDASGWIEWLDPDLPTALPPRLWEALQPLTRALGGPATYATHFPVWILRARDTPLASLVDTHAEDIVRLLFLDRGQRRLKPALVDEELERDYCGREGGLTLLGRRSGLDLHGAEDIDDEASAGLPPKSVLPFLITVEQLVIERTVLTRLHDRLSPALPGSIDTLLAVKQDVLDALEEYSGAITAANRFSDAVAADGERLLGITNLYDAVMDRLDAVSFAITQRYQIRMTLLQFWLTVVFGATEIGSIAAMIATWHYQAQLGAVLAWTVGTALTSGLAIVALLRGRLE